jgi:tRNA (adenine22-N1)-methyltransferase
MVSLRLRAIINLIDKEERLIDIGCDHGLVGITALMENRVKEVTASDINPKALKSAKKNIEKYNIENITTIVSDGLNDINVNNNDLVLLSGMGFRTIKNIFNNPKSKVIDKIIIQSNNDLYELRKFMTKKYYIETEKLIFEKGHYYIVIFFKKGKKKYSFLDLYLGPEIRRKETEYMKFIYNNNQSIIDDISKNYSVKKIKLICINIFLKNQINGSNE